MNTKNFWAITIIGMVVLLSSCGAESTYDGLIPEEKPTPATPEPEPQRPNDPTFRQVVRQSIVVNEDTTVLTTTTVQLDNDSLVTRELRFRLGMELQGPSYLVVMDPAATVYTGAERPTTTEGAWTLSGTDSLRTNTCVSGFKFSYYQMSVETTNKVGFTLIGGKWVPYLAATLSTTFHRFTSEWEPEEIVREDSIFQREKTKNEFNVTARWDGGQRSFILSKVVIIDHFIKMVEPEVEEPEDNTVEADLYVKGLSKFLGAKRDLNQATGKWFDGTLFEGSEEYLCIVAYPTYASGKETYSAPKGYTVSMTVCPKGNYNGVMYYDGGFYPAYYTINAAQRQWTSVARINGKDVQGGFSEHEADTRGIKNFRGNDTARCTPELQTQILSEKMVNGYKVIEVQIKSSLGLWTVKVADEALRPATGK